MGARSSRRASTAPSPTRSERGRSLTCSPESSRSPPGGMPMPADGRVYDVAILGTGIGGTLLGAILAANGQKVLLLEQGTHPRFAIGESTIPETTVLLRLMAKRYGVPEL